MPPPVPGSSRSPTRARRPSDGPRGFIIPPKPKRQPISSLSVRDLLDLREKNARILAAPGPSGSGFVHRISVEQAEIESRLIDLVGVAGIQNALHDTRLDGSEPMAVEAPRLISAKQRALAQFATRTGNHQTGSGISSQEATRLEQEAHAAERQRQEDLLERRRRTGRSIPGEVLTRQEREARMWAFMNYKPTNSDMEDDSDEEEEEDSTDPSSWFDDEEEDGRKGQPIIEPDDDDQDLSHLIRIDESKIPYKFQYGGTP